MKAMVIGLGSMGNRRIRIMKRLYPDIVICGVDIQKSRRDEAVSKWDITVYTSINEAIAAKHPEIAFVCTSPLSHETIIRECLLNNLHVFTELNLVPDGYEENIELANKKEKILFLSSTFLYRDETQYICKKAQKQTKPLSYRYHVGQYLPDWHPWENYTDYFIGDSRTNGCRELLAIEIPWLIRAFGHIDSVQVSRRKLTTLKTTYNDCVCIILNHKNRNIGNLCVDVVSRKAVRKFELIGEDIYLTWDGTPDNLQYYDMDKKQEIPVRLTEHIDRQKGYESFVVENAYENELKAFLLAIEKGYNSEYNFEDDIKTLEMIDRIEGAT